MSIKCTACNDTGFIVVQTSGRSYVSRDMAMDAGDMNLEGTLYTEDEWEQRHCPDCTTPPAPSEPGAEGEI